MRVRLKRPVHICHEATLLTSAHEEIKFPRISNDKLHHHDKLEINLRFLQIPSNLPPNNHEMGKRRYNRYLARALSLCR